MKRIAREVILRIPLRILRRFNNIGNNFRKNYIHLFLLSPPLSGSTVIKELIATSPNVTCFKGLGEGQNLPGAREILMLDNRWDPKIEVNWTQVKEVFYSHWNPFKKIRFEKSPPHIVRAVQLEKVFKNSYFIITIRNPYAFIEGLLRRQKSFSPKEAATFWTMTAGAQMRNLKHFRRKLFFTYEQLTERPNEIVSLILDFLPELEYLNPNLEFNSHNTTDRPISGLKNLNKIKIDRLTKSQVSEIDSVLCNHRELLARFGYEMI